MLSIFHTLYICIAGCVLIWSVYDGHIIASGDEHSRNLGSSNLGDLRYDDIISEYSFYRMEHPHSPELLQLVRECYQNALHCEEFQQLQKVYALAAKITNQHAALLITDHARSLFQDIHMYLDPQRSSKLSAKVCHILYVISFALGDLKQVYIFFINALLFIEIYY